MASNNPFLDPDLEAAKAPRPNLEGGLALSDTARSTSNFITQTETAFEAEHLVHRHRTGGVAFNPLDNDVTVDQGGYSDSDTVYDSEDEDGGEYGYSASKDHAPGVLSSLMQLYNTHLDLEEENDVTATKQQSVPSKAKLEPVQESVEEKAASSESDDDDSDLKSFIAKPRWYSQASMSSQASLMSSHIHRVAAKIERRRKGEARTTKEKGKHVLGRVKDKIHTLREKRKFLEEATITVHIANTLQRQKYILKLARSLLQYGAPSHRIEDYVSSTARALKIPCSFVYLPGLMIISFADPGTHTSDVQLVRAMTSVDLGKLQHVHTIYKEVLHDVIGADNGTRRLEKLMRQPAARNVWFKVLLYGLASAAIGPLFDARIKDLPFCFLLGLIVALIGLILNPKSEAFTNVFEILSTIIVSFFARAFGSIRYDGKEVFCFSGIAQGAIAPMLLPGYIILIGALEIQSKKLVAGAVRMFYAVIYSVLLWFGISIGTALYGGVDPNATITTTCSDTNLREYRFFFVPLFTFFVLLANQAQWKQAPVMLVISMLGYTVNYFAVQRFSDTVQVANALSSLTIGILGNTYSRIAHQAAFNAMLPAILLQVQSGIASQGSLAAGLRTAQIIVSNNNGSISRGNPQIDYGAAELAYSIVAISIGISFGLFLSSCIVYPFGKRRSGLFSF